MINVPSLIVYSRLGSTSYGRQLMEPAPVSTAGSAAGLFPVADDHGGRAGRSYVDAGLGTGEWQSPMNESGGNPHPQQQEEELQGTDAGSPGGQHHPVQHEGLQGQTKGHYFSDEQFATLMEAFEKGHLPKMEMAAKLMEALEKEHQSKVEVTAAPEVPPGQSHPSQAGVHAGYSRHVIPPQPIWQS